MLSLVKKIVLIIMLVFTTIVTADEALRVNMKQAMVKGCSSGAAKDVSLKGLNTDEYCICSAKNLIDGLSDDELKQAFLGADKSLFQTKMLSAASLCMTTNSSGSAFIKAVMYKGCINKPSFENAMINKEAYCGCVSDKFSVNISQDDMRDAIAVGQGSTTLVNTNMANKLMSIAAECINQTVN